VLLPEAEEFMFQTHNHVFTVPSIDCNSIFVSGQNYYNLMVTTKWRIPIQICEIKNSIL